MKKTAFYLAFFLLPAIPAFFYVKGTGSGFDSYSLSVVLGVYVFCMVCNQFMLASRLRFAVSVIGQGGVLALHKSMPGLILIVALVHRALKAANGFVFSSVQALLGSIAWVLFLFAALVAFFLMGGFKSFRPRIHERIGLDYRKARGLHNVAVIAGVVIMAHVLLASSSAFSENPFGVGILAVWMAVSLGMYLVYRLRGRKERIK